MAKRRSLLPREHGAYAQLAAPILAALVVRRPGLPSAMLAVAAVAAFLANEPLLVVLGHRGARLRRTEGPRATRRLVALAGAALACAAVGLSLAGVATIQIAAVTGVPIVGLLVLAWRRGQHSIAGELVAALALPAAAAPIAVASGLDGRSAVTLWVAWSLGYAASVIAVHRVIARHRGAATRLDLGLALILGTLGLGLVALGQEAPHLVVALPLVTLATAIVLRPPRARRLRAVGVALVVASLASIGVAVWVT